MLFTYPHYHPCHCTYYKSFVHPRFGGYAGEERESPTLMREEDNSGHRSPCRQEMGRSPHRGALDSADPRTWS